MHMSRRGSESTGPTVENPTASVYFTHARSSTISAKQVLSDQSGMMSVCVQKPSCKILLLSCSSDHMHICGFSAHPSNANLSRKYTCTLSQCRSHRKSWCLYVSGTNILYTSLTLALHVVACCLSYLKSLAPHSCKDTKSHLLFHSLRTSL